MNSSEEILKIEWEMFSNVNNVGGKASCQNNYDKFRIMRMSQILAWNEEIRSSYYDDLKSAINENRNLLQEKYARMMYFTFKSEYDKIEHLLPEIDKKKHVLVDEITYLHEILEQEFKKVYPNISGRGRGSSGGTTISIYLKGELLTYSINTLELLKKYIYSLNEKGESIVEKIYINTIKFYGYESLEQAEKYN